MHAKHRPLLKGLVVVEKRGHPKCMKKPQGLSPSAQESVMPLKPRVGGQQRGLMLPGCSSLGCWDMQGHLRSSCRGQAKSGTLGRLTCCSPKAQACKVQLSRREARQGGPISLVCSFGEGPVPAVPGCRGRLRSVGQPCAWLRGVAVEGESTYIVAEREASSSQPLQIGTQTLSGLGSPGQLLLCHGQGSPRVGKKPQVPG